MKILITGSNGFIGRNLVWNLKEIQDGNNRTRPGVSITEIYSFNKGSAQSELAYACERADFVFHLAGANRPKEQSEFTDTNIGLTNILLETLKKYKNKCPVMFASSTQASLMGRFEGSAYGKSKLAAEELFFQYAEETGAKVFVYRFPNVFGKWCRPHYNSVVATFCNAVANDLDYTVHDASVELELLYIDDLIQELLEMLEGNEHHCAYNGLDIINVDGGKYCYVPTTHYATIGEIVKLLQSFHQMPYTRFLPQIPPDSFEKKLYSTYQSYLPKERMTYCFQPHIDSRGMFTELFRTQHSGQVSINVAKPGAIRGQHWHNSKWEIFIVVCGHGLIRERRIGVNPKSNEPYPVIEFEVTGEQLKAVQILPGYSHSIINLSQTEDLVTVMWANEPFDKSRPDTFYEPVDYSPAQDFTFTAKSRLRS